MVNCMKFFRKEKEANGRRNVYICGLKVFSYKRKLKLDDLLRLCDIPNLKSLVYKGIVFPHPVGIVISDSAVIGKNCIIFQNVTIGANFSPKASSQRSVPVIGDNVIICAGAVIVGGVTIGDEVIIGANSVVTKDVPPNTLCYGSPAKCYPLKEKPSEIYNRIEQ